MIRVPWIGLLQAVLQVVGQGSGEHGPEPLRRAMAGRSQGAGNAAFDASGRGFVNVNLVIYAITQLLIVGY